MTDPTVFQMQTGRFFWTGLLAGQDITVAVAGLCRRFGLAAAVFAVSGQVTVATVGTYDAAQQVWVTQKESGGADIVLCRGDVLRAQDQPRVCGQILLADTAGRVFGGRLFADTLVAAAEVQLLELLGKGPTRTHDSVSARWFLADPL
jgi:predicted DNA-binding protein with PD1-like motif